MIETLGRMGPDAKVTIPMLTALLKDPNRHVRSNAALALGEMKDDAVDLIPGLDEMSRTDADWTNRQVAKAALNVIKPSDYQAPKVFKRRNHLWFLPRLPRPESQPLPEEK
jgi:HEAT repeat protein